MPCYDPDRRDSADSWLTQGTQAFNTDLVFEVKAESAAAGYLNEEGKCAGQGEQNGRRELELKDLEQSVKLKLTGSQVSS